VRNIPISFMRTFLLDSGRDGVNLFYEYLNFLVFKEGIWTNTEMSNKVLLKKITK
jgi:hypothetical protein